MASSEELYTEFGSGRDFAALEPVSQYQRDTYNPSHGSDVRGIKPLYIGSRWLSMDRVQRKIRGSYQSEQTLDNRPQFRYATAEEQAESKILHFKHRELTKKNVAIYA
jgi:hypothetical protein